MGEPINWVKATELPDPPAGPLPAPLAKQWAAALIFYEHGPGDRARSARLATRRAEPAKVTEQHDNRTRRTP